MHRDAAPSLRNRVPGVLGRLHAVASSLAVQRYALEVSYEASRQATRAAASRVMELDAALAGAAANQAVLQAKRRSLDSVGRRKLRGHLWRALGRDQLALAYHEGGQRLGVAVVASLTANAARCWVAEIWLPVRAPLPSEGAPLVLWQLVVDAARRAQQELGGEGDALQVVSSNGVVGIRLAPPDGTPRDRLQDVLTAALDRARVQAVALQETRVDVSVIWLDLDAPYASAPEPIGGFEMDDMDTLVGPMVGE